MRFAFVTDVHFGPAASHEGKLRKLSHFADSLSCEFVERMNEVERPDVVVNLGDVIEDESPESDEKHYRRFAEILAGLRGEVLHVAGNHDLVNISDDRLAEIWGHTGPLHYSRDFDGVRVVVLRTHHRRATDVRLPDEQIEWLRAELEQSKQPTLVFVHHPLSEMRLDGNRWFEKQPHICRVAERRRVREVLEASGKVIGVFNGHVHWNHLDVIRGIPYVTIQSLTENVDDDAPGTPARTHAIVDVDRHRMVVRIEGAQPARYQFEL